MLLRFPDRPGGRIVWRGMEVSSAGAGLPLIVLGVAVVGADCDPGDSYEPRELIEAHGNLTAELGGTRSVLGTRPTEVDISFDFALG